MYYLICVCSSCKKRLGTRPTEFAEQHLKLSHGFCLDCVTKLYGDEFTADELKELLKEISEEDRRHNES